MSRDNSEKAETLRRLSGVLAAPLLSAEQAFSHERVVAFGKLLDLVENEPDCQYLLKSWGADRETVAELYSFLLRAGAGRLVDGQYMPCMVVADPWTLEYLLACRETHQLNADTAARATAFCAGGDRKFGLLGDPHCVAVATMLGPNTGDSYRPYSITALHHREAEEWEDRKTIRGRLKQCLMWPGAIIEGLALLEANYPELRLRHRFWLAIFVALLAAVGVWWTTGFWMMIVVYVGAAWFAYSTTGDDPDGDFVMWLVGLAGGITLAFFGRPNVPSTWGVVYVVGWTIGIYVGGAASAVRRERAKRERRADAVTR